MSQVAEAEVEVANAQGLHVGPARDVAKTALMFLSKITVSNGETTANARSIVEMTALGIGFRGRLTIRAEGSDADAALKTMVALFNSKFRDS
jgi:phosphotransferase system HPr (HPr) family protein